MYIYFKYIYICIIIHMIHMYVHIYIGIMFLSDLTGEIRTGQFDAADWVIEDDGRGYPIFVNTRYIYVYVCMCIYIYIYIYICMYMYVYA
jgi:hypothetical protein